MLRQKIITIITLFATSLFAYSMHLPAEAAEKKSSLNAAFEILLSTKPIESAGLLIVANTVENSCRQYRSRVPSLSPRESDWLNKELSANNIGPIVQTTEFSRWRLSDRLDSCIRNAHMAGSLTKEYSMPFWVRLSLDLRDSDNTFHAEKLSKSKVSNFNDDDLNAIGFGYSMIGESILSSILLPWLESRTP